MFLERGDAMGIGDFAARRFGIQLHRRRALRHHRRAVVANLDGGLGHQCVGPERALGDRAERHPLVLVDRRGTVVGRYPGEASQAQLGNLIDQKLATSCGAATASP